MWARFADLLRCTHCRGPFELVTLEPRATELAREHVAAGERFGLGERALSSALDSGLLVCRSCKLWFPILHGLPVLLPYRTRTHDEFLASHAPAVRALGGGFDTPQETPAAGEEFVLRTFSREWLDYSYDGVVWTWTYEDREALFLAEIGVEPRPPVPARFLEVGCGLGLVTAFAAKHFPGDAVGLDLSLAALRASTHFRGHPFLHFVQASLWRPPFAEQTFDLVYSHGVIHHTHSTEQALHAVAPLCRRGGRLYLWVYGDVATRETLSRRVAYAVEQAVRPLVSRMPPALASAVLAPFALLYIAINRLQRLLGRPRQPYNYARALHAARDRLTPLFAHHASAATVAGWLRAAGFGELHQVGEDEVPASARDTMRRNVGLRGRRL
jgi:SAM-dependent methyltransferase/uncharacterized protein YbaR (Trm112 family)